MNTVTPSIVELHDLTIAGRIKVKNDRAAIRTGNIAVEVECRGKPSGISNSTATGWVFVVGREVFMLSSAALKELLKRGSYRRVRVKEDAVIALVPLADLRRIARSITIGDVRR